ncbi:3,5-dihydroxyphenylacetyl-CoA synthase DpgA [Micromonospora orduensis]|nr:3,5-dihydroxyphenylacetyl-CoA synthase DpgA [Micromonospora orduensis]
MDHKPLEKSYSHRFVEPRIVSVGTATPPTGYTQMEVLDHYRITDQGIRSVFLNSHIDQRFLSLPLREAGERPSVESQSELLAKHRVEGVRLAAEALHRCLAPINAAPSDVDLLCCVTSTGWLTPGLSALLVRDVGMRPDCGRLDVVGMGCNAGLNGLNPVTNWARANPGGLAVMICVEVCSAAYVFDGEMRSAVVNSLFGDGAAAVAVRCSDNDTVPAVTGYARHIITSAMDAMRYDWDERHGKFSFFLDPDVPYVVGAHAERVVDALLSRAALGRSDIAHWIVHPGGKKVIDAVRVNLELTHHDLRHTTEVLRSYGNVSSSSFLFAYQNLVDEGAARPGDRAVMMTMGPGSTIESALLTW